MIVTTISEQKRVYNAAKKLGGYQEFIAYAAQRKKERENDIES